MLVSFARAVILYLALILVFPMAWGLYMSLTNKMIGTKEVADDSPGGGTRVSPLPL